MNGYSPPEFATKNIGSWYCCKPIYMSESMMTCVGYIVIIKVE